MQRNAPYLAAFLSGLGALIMESVWIRQFALVIGASTPSLSLVLSVYMAGLALGSIIAPRVAGRAAQRRRRYILVEIAIAASGFALSVVLMRFNLLFEARAVSLLLALVWMLGVTLLMGTTTPLLVGLLPRSRGGPDQSIGWLYAVNTAGAACGALAAGFVLFEHFGLIGSSALAACANLLAAHRAAATSITEVVEPAAPPSLRLVRLPWLLTTVVGISSLFGMAMEVLLSRTLVMIFSSHGYAIACLLGGLLGGLALGALLVARWRPLTRDPLLTLACAMLALAALTALAPQVLVAFRTQESSILAWVGTHWSRYLLATTSMIAAVTVPLGAILGVVPPLVVIALHRQRHSLTLSLGWVGLVSGLGSIAGPPLAAFVLLPWLGLGPAFTFMSVVTGLAGLGLATRAHGWRLALPTACVLALLIGIAPLHLTERMTAPGDTLIFSDDSSFGSAVVVEDPLGIRYLLTNLGGAVGDDSPAHVLMQQRQYLLPAMVAARRELVAEIGLGTGITISPVVADRQVQRLTALEISPAVVDAARVFNATNLGVLEEERVEVVVDDGRAWLKRQPEHSLDLILVELFNGEEQGISALYSRQFYRLCATRLRAGGVLAQSLSLVELPAPELKSILGSMHENFSSVQLWLAYPYILVATASDHVPQQMGLRIREAVADPELGPLMRRAGLRAPQDVLGRFLCELEDSQLVSGVAPVDDRRPSLESRVPRSLLFIGRNRHLAAMSCASLISSLEAPPAWMESDVSPELLRQLSLREPYLRALAAHAAGQLEQTRSILQEILAWDPHSVDARILGRSLEIQGSPGGS